MDWSGFIRALREAVAEMLEPLTNMLELLRECLNRLRQGSMEAAANATERDTATRRARKATPARSTARGPTRGGFAARCRRWTAATGQ